MISSIGTSNYYLGQMSSMWSRQGSAGMSPPPSPEEMFGEVDTDGSGGLDQTEFSTLAAKISATTGEEVDAEEIFAAYDEDGDGVLNEEETQSVMEAYRPEGPPPGGMMGGMGGMGGPGMMGGPPPDLSQLISDADEDEDGSLNETEAQTLADIISEVSGEEVGAEELIAAYDEDGDGLLSEEESLAAMEAKRPEDPPPPDGMIAQNQISPYDSFMGTSAGIANYLQMSLLGTGQNENANMLSMFGGQGGSGTAGIQFSVNTRI